MLVCYAASGKSKAPAICGAFALGAGGAVVRSDAPRGFTDHEAVDAFIFGSSVENFARIDRCRHSHSSAVWFYGDGAYGFGRGKFFRITRGALQVDGLTGRADSARWHRHGIEVKPWRRAGAAVVIAAQSDAWHRWTSGTSAAEWGARTALAARKHTDREIKICAHKGGPAFAEALHSAWAVIVHSSSAAIAALIEGVPAFCLEPCAASPMALSDLARLERPYYAEDREPWLWRLAAAQWTREEIAAGDAWRALTGAGA